MPQASGLASPSLTSSYLSEWLFEYWVDQARDMGEHDSGLMCPEKRNV